VDENAAWFSKLKTVMCLSSLRRMSLRGISLTAPCSGTWSVYFAEVRKSYFNKRMLCFHNQWFLALTWTSGEISLKKQYLLYMQIC